MKKNIFSIILTTLMTIIFVHPVIAASPNDVTDLSDQTLNESAEEIQYSPDASGIVSDKLSWTYSKGVLTVEGSDRFWQQPEWESFRDEVYKVVVCEGIPEIQTYGFASFTNLVEIDIADSVTNMSSGVFMDCTSLEEIELPPNLINIGAKTFSGCTSLRKVNIPKTITQIQEETFKNCTSLEELVLPDNVLYILKEAFMGCTNLNSLVIPDSISIIKENAFAGCNSLKTVGPIDSDCNIKIGWKTQIPQNAFSGCSGITAVTIPDSIQIIQPGAFIGCTNLTNVTIPASVLEIWYGAFTGCTNLTDVYYDGIPLEWYLIGGMNEDTGLNSDQITIHYELFVDVKKTDWFRDAVYTNYEKGFMTGMEEYYYGAYESLSRAQFALILYRMEGEPDIDTANTFKDIAGDEWYADAVLWAQKNGIVTGYLDGNFGPADMITREQMVVMMYRYANYLNQNTDTIVDLSKFKDADAVNSYALSAMQWGVGNNIITGKEEGTMLDPQGFTARAECAAIIQRFTSKK